MRIRAKHRAILGWAAGGLVIAALAGFSVARYVTTASHAAADEPAPAAVLATAPEASSAVDPLTRFTAALNDARQRLGLGELAWSETLAKATDTSARKIASGACTVSAAEREGQAADAAVFWAAALPRMDGADSPQEIAPGYIVSQWRGGQQAADADGACRDPSNACEAWRKLSAPAAREVGCARAVCASNAQVWLCRFGD